MVALSYMFMTVVTSLESLILVIITKYLNNAYTFRIFDLSDTYTHMHRD